MGNFNQVFNSIFKQSLSDKSSKALIEKTTREYPYFSPAQLFLLHFTSRDTTAYTEQIRKTSLLFNNNYWLNFQIIELSCPPKDLVNAIEVLSEPITELPKEEISSSEFTNDTSTVASNPTPMLLGIESTITDTIIADEQLIENLTVVTEPTILQNFSSIEATAENTPDISEASTKTNEIIPVSLAEPIIANVEMVKIELPQHIKDTQGENYKNMQPAADIQDEDELPINCEEVTIDEEMKQVRLKIAESLSAIAADSNSTSDSISFEPLHTSDYFASVGIKLSDEVKSNDRLGLQMKSFTQWLKTMKKVHADQLKETGIIENQLSVQNDETIQKLAEASNKENMVVTEAMAEVLLKQGKIVKAIELYEKLSLLYPSKKAYFANLLINIKG